MELTKEDYQRQLMQLLPEGPVWPRDPDTFMAGVLGAAAETFARVDGAAGQLLAEFDPRLSGQLLDDWERVVGLPDECLTPANTVAERRRRLHQKVVWQGGQSVDFFLQFLYSLGYPRPGPDLSGLTLSLDFLKQEYGVEGATTISEFRPMRAGSKCNAALNQGGWRYAWRVNIPQGANVKRLTATGRVNEALGSWGDPGLACLLAKYKPAHTIVYISYGGDA